MKNALLVTSHPYIESFNFALRNQAIELLHKLDWQVSTSDLYQQGFCPILGPNDFQNHSVEATPNLIEQQKIAHQQSLFNEDIIKEQKKLLNANLLILQFPLWWGSYPAMLKGWIERIISSGYAYGSNFLLENKRVLLSVTTGGAKEDSEIEYYQKKIYELGTDIFTYAKMSVLKPIINHGPAYINDSQRQSLFENSEQQLISLLTSSLFTNAK